MPIATSLGPINRLLENRAQTLFDQGLFHEAIEAAEAGVDSARRLFVDGDEMAVTNLLDAMLVEADIRRHTGYMDAAEEEYREVIQIGTDTGRMARQLAFARAGLGDIAEERGHSTEALRQYESAVRGLESVGSSVTEECARLRNNLAMLYKDDGDFQAAEQHLIAGIQSLEGVVGRYNATAATLYNNLATLYMKVGHMEEAKEMAMIAYDVRREVLPPNHVDCIQSLSNLGAIHYELDDMDAATQAFSQAVQAMEDNHSVDPHDYEVVVANYIDLLLSSGQTEESAYAAQRARERYQELIQMRTAYATT